MRKKNRRHVGDQGVEVGVGRVIKDPSLKVVQATTDDGSSKHEPLHFEN